MMSDLTDEYMHLEDVLGRTIYFIQLNLTLPVLALNMVVLKRNLPDEMLEIT